MSTDFVLLNWSNCLGLPFAKEEPSIIPKLKSNWNNIFYDSESFDSTQF
jgi:hypothetical protein